MRVVPTGQQGQEAYTAYVPIATSPSRTLVRLTITTGVRHQIRVHLAALGHPIVGDTHYGPPSKEPRLYLHAEALAFTSPATGQWVRYTSPAPQDFFTVAA
jgi:23S rRNA pseudouridine1911/1915/1917 synthase